MAGNDRMGVVIQKKYIFTGLNHSPPTKKLIFVWADYARNDTIHVHILFCVLIVFNKRIIIQICMKIHRLCNYHVYPWAGRYHSI